MASTSGVRLNGFYESDESAAESVTHCVTLALRPLQSRFFLAICRFWESFLKYYQELMLEGRDGE